MSRNHTIDLDLKDQVKNLNLKFVDDTESGYKRIKKGKGFLYINKEKKIVKDEKLLKRFRLLVIPPAWEKVWICETLNGHIQVTGRDARNRKQYIYHSKWNDLTNENKFFRLQKFGEKLPILRAKVEEDLRKPFMEKEKVLAIIVKLLDETFIRIGNSVYAEKNKSYGLTTLTSRHIKFNGTKINIRFNGKSGKVWDLDIKDKRIVNLITKCHELPGQKLFTYLDEEGNPHSVESEDVNIYLKENMGDDFTAKDFRTWAGTVAAVEELIILGKQGKDDYEKEIKKVIKNVAKKLFNTVSICKKYYIHPAIFEAFEDNSLFKQFIKAKKNINLKKYFFLNEFELAVLNTLKAQLPQG